MHPDTSLSSPFSSAFLHDRTVFVVGVAAAADVLKRNVFAQRTKATATRDTFDKEAFSESQLARAQTQGDDDGDFDLYFAFFRCRRRRFASLSHPIYAN